MNKIKRAIETLELMVVCTSSYGADEIEAFKTSLTVLRAELEREKNPLTCEGCELDVKDDGSMRYSRCGNCTRQERPWTTDRYEPKGEQNV